MSAREPNSFLPDFCQAGAILKLLLVSQILAIVLALGAPGEALVPGTRLVLISLFLHWITLLCAGALCWLRRHLGERSVALVGTAAFAMLLGISLLVSEMAYQIGRLLLWEPFLQPHAHGHFLVRNTLLVGIVGLLLLRYLYVLHAWRREVEALAGARFEALQARIRPHFFFNSLNSVAALITIRPEQAESLLEDLSDLFRAILKSQQPRHSLREEVELARTYLRIEELRLGERLRQQWELPEDLDTPQLPLLSLQPLLENAIYHGIERLPEGGTLRVRIRTEADQLRIEIRNPVPPEAAESRGSHTAQDNVRQRLRLLYDDRASLTIRNRQGEYRAELRVPL